MTHKGHSSKCTGYPHRSPALSVPGQLCHVLCLPPLLETKAQSSCFTRAAKLRHLQHKALQEAFTWELSRVTSKTFGSQAGSADGDGCRLQLRGRRMIRAFLPDGQGNTTSGPEHGDGEEKPWLWSLGDITRALFLCYKQMSWVLWCQRLCWEGEGCRAERSEQRVKHCLVFCIDVLQAWQWSQLMPTSTGYSTSWRRNTDLFTWR